MQYSDKVNIKQRQKKEEEDLPCELEWLRWT